VTLKKAERSNTPILLDAVFANFIKESPLSVMMRATLENALSSEAVDQLFEKTAARQYVRELLFSTVVNLMAMVVFRIRASIHAAYQANKDSIPVSVTAVYDKVDRMEPEVAAALVRHVGERLAPVVDATGGAYEPWLPGYQLRIVDGNHLAATDRRLGVLRGSKAGPLPGQCLVVLDPSRMLVTDVIPCEDGHAQERSLTNELLALVRANDVWLDDRNFCTARLLFGILERDAFFITRQHASTPSWRAVGDRRKRGRIETGTVYEQEVVIWEGQEATDRVLHVRRITVVLDAVTRDGDAEIHILTNLPQEVASAGTIAELYRKRWTLETAFQELQATLSGEISALGYPKAALFAFCVALVAYNVLSTMKAALRAAHGHDRVNSDVSGYYIADEVCGTYRGMMIAIPVPNWTAFGNLTAVQLAKRLVAIAVGVKLGKLQRHPRGPKKPVTPRTRYVTEKHVSTARLLAEAGRAKRGARNRAKKAP
jgi:IS4 transposase